MKPKAQVAHDEGFLEYLEDIIGTNKYIEKIAESFKHLKVLKSGVIGGVKNEAEAYMLKELSLLKCREMATKLAFEVNSTQISEMQTNISGQEENLKLQRWGLFLNKGCANISVPYVFDNSLRRCKDEFKEFERQDVKYREDLSHLKHKIKKLNDKLD
ncbi:hypothetical protein H5410_006819 [Solanum commersonii]|uniref:Uncharacterized protein n=1 Tax=Solanum commersonii TaxID=4109 RepID=A0A9J6AAV7_SOLCO|nr:hypothetical protein H5410_006819 [Solanum commersonii]